MIEEALCEEKHKNIDKEITDMKNAIECFSKKLYEAKTEVTNLIIKILVSAFIVFGGTAIALIIFIVTQLPRIAAP